MEQRVIKRVAAIHDLSGFGRASLTAIIPTLSSMGVQVCPLPTAILSNHTGGFDHYSFVDLTDTMEEYIDHWKRLNLTFDCIYSGFLGSVRQIEIVAGFLDHFGGEDTLAVVDPVMGDNGRLYSSMKPEITEEMKKLVGKADIITPNFTEAAFLLGEPYREEITDEEVKAWLLRLSEMGPRTVIITSVPGRRVTGQVQSEDTNVIAYDRPGNAFLEGGMPVHPRLLSRHRGHLYQRHYRQSATGGQPAGGHRPGGAVHLPVHQGQLRLRLSPAGGRAAGKGVGYPENARHHGQLRDAVKAAANVFCPIGYS